MRANYNKLKQIIGESGLPFEKQAVMNVFFSSAKDDDLGDVVALIEKDRALLETVYSNIEQKWSAGSDLQKWQNVLDAEEKQLKTIQ